MHLDDNNSLPIHDIDSLYWNNSLACQKENKENQMYTSNMCLLKKCVSTLKIALQFLELFYIEWKQCLQIK